MKYSVLVLSTLGVAFLTTACNGEVEPENSNATSASESDKENSETSRSETSDPEVEPSKPEPTGDPEEGRCGVPQDYSPYPELQYLVETTQCQLNSFAEKMISCGIAQGPLIQMSGIPDYYEGCTIGCLNELIDCSGASAAYCEEAPFSAELEHCLDECDDSFVCADGSGSNIERCDGYVGCADGSDEADCGMWTLPCGDGEFYPTPYRCDGDNDCDNGADELDCEPHFVCGDSSTIWPEWVCDGEEDCADGSDEVTCSGSRMFQCADGETFPLSYQCDEEIDCADGSDEHSGCFSIMCE